MRNWSAEVRRRLGSAGLDPVQEADVVEELARHLEDRYEELRSRGVAEDEAAELTMAELGEEGAIAPRIRTAAPPRRPASVPVGAVSGHGISGALWGDVRFGVRLLRRSPIFTAAAVLALALGVGAITAIFSAVNPILFDPLPYPDAHRLAMLWDVGVDGSRADVTFGTYREFAERSQSFEGLAVMRPWQPTLTGATQPERLDGQRVSAGYFRALGVSPALGRDFLESEDRAGGPRVVILSHGLWQRRFGGDRSIVERQVTLDGIQYSVAGVMPASLENVLAPSAEAWSPLQYDPTLPPDGREWGHHLRMIGRLRPAVALEEAAREMDIIARTPLADFPRVPWASLERGIIVSPLQDDLTRGVRPALFALFGAALLVLLIACVNVANLLLARGARRQGELAMRRALGAERSRIVQQLLTESLLLAVIGGTLGMVVAGVGVQALVLLSPPELPRAGAIRLDWAAFLFASGVTTLIGLLVGLVPALHASRSDLRSGAQQGSRRSTGRRRLTRGLLVVTQIAIALVLLIGAGLLLRSVERLFEVSPGFDSSNLLAMQVQTAGSGFENDDATHRFFLDALEAVRHVPGVTEAAFTSQLPLSGDLDTYGVRFESLPNDDPDEDLGAFRYAVSPSYFETMRIPLRRGRLLDSQDVAGAPPAVVINESFARRRFPGRNPIGQRLHVGRTDLPWYTVVGVVGDVKQASLAVAQEDAVYVLASQWYFADRARWLVVRARGDAAALVTAVRDAIWSVDQDQPISRVATMEARVAESAAERRFVLVLLEVFGLVALALAATGMYGVLSGSVAERMREMGVRLALGASPRGILALVVRQGMMLGSVGVLIGLAGAAVASRTIVSLLFGVSRLDPGTYLAVVALMLGVAALACGVPAWRAARVDPATTLRAD